jgi:hypothetical protein
MIRDGLWERERKEKMVKRRMNEGDSGGAVKSYLASSYTAAALLRTASPLYRNEPIDHCQQPSGGCSVNSLSDLRSPDSLSKCIFLRNNIGQLPRTHIHHVLFGKPIQGLM